MRINRYIALATGLGRRKVDVLINTKQVMVNSKNAIIGQNINAKDNVYLNGDLLNLPNRKILLALNKPPGFVVSRLGQNNKTIYDLLPKVYHILKPIGRLDKDSSGLLLLTNDGDLAFRLTHPNFEKDKVYIVHLDKILTHQDLLKVQNGILLSDGISKLKITVLGINKYKITLSEGRNRQIRRTFEKLGYKVEDLDRTTFDKYKKDNIKLGEYKIIDTI